MSKEPVVIVDAQAIGVHRKVRRTGEPADAIIDRAERSIASMADQFLVWARRECDRLERLVGEAADSELRAGRLAAAHEVARELRGQGATYGYHGLTEVAALLCSLLEPRETPPPDQVRVVIAALHVQAAKAIIRERLAASEDPRLQELVAGLEQASRKLLQGAATPAG